jgi:hypothetical protein
MCPSLYMPLNSRPLGSGLIGEVTAPLCMIMQEGHEERTSLFLIDSSAFPVVLGLPWLAYHNPTISWQQRALKGWSCRCSGRCIGVSIGATTVESPNQVSTMHIPPEYADLALTFCKKKATKLLIRLVRSSSLRFGRFLRPLWTSRGPRHILCEPSWTQGFGRGAFSTTWSGRRTVRRRDAGCRWRTS